MNLKSKSGFICLEVHFQSPQHGLVWITYCCLRLNVEWLPEVFVWTQWACFQKSANNRGNKCDNCYILSHTWLCQSCSWRDLTSSLSATKIPTPPDIPGCYWESDLDRGWVMIWYNSMSGPPNVISSVFFSGHQFLECLVWGPGLPQCAAPTLCAASVACWRSQCSLLPPPELAGVLSAECSIRMRKH